MHVSAAGMRPVTIEPAEGAKAAVAPQSTQCAAATAMATPAAQALLAPGQGQRVDVQA